MRAGVYVCVCVVPCHVMLAGLLRVLCMFSYVMLCCVVPLYVMLLYGMLSYGMLWFVMLCVVVLC